MTEHNPLPKPEIMSPVGYWPQLHAAIEAGADAVYFGLKHFTARAKVGFTLTELPEVMRTLHQRGVRGYITFNTVVFENLTVELSCDVTVNVPPIVRLPVMLVGLANSPRVRTTLGAYLARAASLERHFLPLGQSSPPFTYCGSSTSVAMSEFGVLLDGW